MIHVDKLIAKHFSFREVERRLASSGEHPGQRKVGEVYYGPYLLVSREHGSGGDQVARLVGEHLGWRVFDREIVDEIAQHAHVRQQLISTLDERGRSVWEDVVWSALQPEDIGAESYLAHLRQVLLALGQHGDVVIVGRGAEHFLPTDCGLRVRIVAPFELRVERVAAWRGCSLEVAKHEVEKTDHDRAQFHRQYFHHDPLSRPFEYDLLINTRDISFEAAAAIIRTALETKLGVTAIHT